MNKREYRLLKKRENNKRKKKKDKELERIIKNSNKIISMNFKRNWSLNNKIQ